MFEALLTSLQTYYGMDWATMILGMSGSYLISSQNPVGFLLSALACVFGFCVAVISSQFGFIAYNLILATIMLRGYRLWIVTANEKRVCISDERLPEAAE